MKENDLEKGDKVRVSYRVAAHSWKQFPDTWNKQRLITINHYVDIITEHKRCSLRGISYKDVYYSEGIKDRN